MLDITFDKPIKDSEEAIWKAGLNWGVRKEQLYLDNGIPVPNAFTTLRTDNQDPLGIVRGRYAVLQNRDAFKFVDSTIKNTKAAYIGGGSFDGGKTVYLTAQLDPEPMRVSNDDPVHQYITLINNHSGDMRPMAIFSPLRLICLNMLAAMKRYATIRFSHTKGGIDRMKEAETEYQEMIRVYAESLLQYQYLASVPAKSKDVLDFTEALFPIPEDMVRPGGVINSREQVVSLFENGKGSELSTRGTFWNLYNAHVEYLDHYQGRNSTRDKSALIGINAGRKQRSLDLSLEMAKKAA